MGNPDLPLIIDGTYDERTGRSGFSTSGLVQDSRRCILTSSSPLPLPWPHPPHLLALVVFLHQSLADERSILGDLKTVKFTRWSLL